MIRAAIMRGDLKPNQRLIEAELTKELHTSRFHLRSALSRLESEGLIETRKHHGARVREISVEEAIDMVEILMPVASLLAGHAAERAHGADLESVRQLREEVSAAAAHGDVLSFPGLELRLHQHLGAFARNASGASLVEQLNIRLSGYQLRVALMPGHARQGYLRQLAIIDAVQAHNAERSVEITANHVARVAASIKTMGFSSFDAATPR